MGQAIPSCSGMYNLTMQTDGNPVLYRNGVALWSTGTFQGGRARVNPSGYFEVESNDWIYWRVGSGGWDSNERVAIQDDGNVVFYSSGTTQWSSGTCGKLLPGMHLYQGESLSSCDGRFTLVLQGDGNLVLYQNAVGALWATYRSGDHVELQGDGNFVEYAGGTAVWSSGTPGRSGTSLVLQNDGNLVLYSSGGAAWSSGTPGH